MRKAWEFPLLSADFYYIRMYLRVDLQVEYVVMEKQQDDTYRESIEEYRAASRARMAKSSDVNSNNIFKVLPRRQISNYFVQFRKVLSLFTTFSLSTLFRSNYALYLLCLSLIHFFPLFLPS